MISNTDLGALAGKTVYGRDDEKIGKVADVYESNDGAAATFVTVTTGLFAGASFVPLAEASLRDDDLVVPYDKDLVKDAPRVDADEELNPDEEARIYQHYSLSSGTAPAAAAPGPEPAVETEGYDTSGPITDDAMTRSEERLRVGTERVEAGRARLRKRVVTEMVTQQVPVSREEVVLEREPITDGNVGKAMDGPAISEEEHEVVLHAEQVVVQKEAVPVERVRLGTQTVTEQAQVDETVRKEQIEVEGDAAARGGSAGGADAAQRP